MLLSAIRSNPTIVLGTLQKFDTFIAFGQALNPEQQLHLSGNLHRVNEFFKSDQGKAALSLLAEEFVSFTST